jgi:hypothetical protein
LFALLVPPTLTGSAQAPHSPKTTEQIASEMDIKILVPDANVAQKLSDGEKVIERQRHQNEPFEVSELSVQATTIQLGGKLDVRTLSENKNWLKNLQYAIKNTSDRRITYIAHSLIFPQALINGGQMVYTMDVGVPPSPLRSNTEIDILPPPNATHYGGGFLR